MKLYITGLIFLLLVCTAVAACSMPSTTTPAYGAKVRYASGRPLVYPDLTLVYVGERKGEATTNFPAGFVFHDFSAQQGAEKITVSWSAGTGDIGPVTFAMAGRQYRLELKLSDNLGRLSDGELVLWQD